MKSTTVKFILVLIIQVVVFTNDLLSQSTFTITGKVLSEAHRPIIGASVNVSSSKDNLLKTVTTAQDGSFKLSINTSLNYIIKISHTGYQPYSSESNPSLNKDFGNIILLASIKNLKEVVIEAKQNPVTLDGNTLIFDVSKTMSAQGTNALEALGKAPGVFIDNNANISLNGKPNVMVLLDGKQTYLSSKEIAEILRAMPSSQIKTIEIINSPSAKYDAAGAAGIINIKTSKSQIKGFSGNLTGGLSYGVTLKQNQDFSINYRKNNFNIYGGYNHFFGHYKYLYGTDRTQSGGNYISETDDTDKRNRMGNRLGIDYNLNPKNTIGILMTGNFIFGGGKTETHTDIVEQQQNLDAYNDYYHQNTQRYNLNFNYKYEDSLGKILNIDADYGYYQKDAGNFQNNRYTSDQNLLISETFYRTINAAAFNLKAIKVDYSINLWKGKFETGAKYSSIGTANNTQFFQVLSTVEKLDEQRSNQFTFDERIASAYVNYKRNYGIWVFQGGLRLENTSSIGVLAYKLRGVGNENDVNRNYINLFPSASASVNLNKDNTLSFGYARRIDRPAYQDLNPFVYLLDELSFFSGNPFLKPQLSQRLNLLYAFKNTTILGFNYAYSTNFKANITDAVDDNKIVLIPRNVGSQHSFSLTLTQQFNLKKWWNLTLNGTLSKLQNNIDLDEARSFDLDQTAGRVSLQQTFKLPFKLTAEIFSTYNSKRLIGANEVVKPISQVDLGLQRNLFKDKATLRMVFVDIYKGSASNSTQVSPGFSLQSHAYYETRQIRLNFSYKFANAAVKSPRTRNSALENENGRIK